MTMMSSAVYVHSYTVMGGAYRGNHVRLSIFRYFCPPALSIHRITDIVGFKPAIIDHSISCVHFNKRASRASH